MFLGIILVQGGDLSNNKLIEEEVILKQKQLELERRSNRSFNSISSLVFACIAELGLYLVIRDNPFCGIERPFVVYAVGYFAGMMWMAIVKSSQTKTGDVIWDSGELKELLFISIFSAIFFMVLSMIFGYPAQNLC
jgi:hypothetical protein